jgi:predicted GTPase
MALGAGLIAARLYGAAELADPRPYAVGSLRETFERNPHIGGLLPAAGYGEIQIKDLEETINRTPCDVVLLATPADLTPVLRLNKPCLRVSYGLEERTAPGLRQILDEFTARWGSPAAA